MQYHFKMYGLLHFSFNLEITVKDCIQFFLVSKDNRNEKFDLNHFYYKVKIYIIIANRALFFLDR